MCSQKRNSAASVPFSIFMCLREIYIFHGSAQIFFCSRIGRPNEEELNDNEFNNDELAGYELNYK
jgi:hypothetical protein